MSVLVPLYNMNTLVAVGIGLVLLGEWRDVSVWRLLAGAALIVAGGVLGRQFGEVEWASHMVKLMWRNPVIVLSRHRL